VWCTDYKGQFRLGNRQYCYPLTTSDLLTRFLLTLESLDGTDEEEARPIFETRFGNTGCRCSFVGQWTAVCVARLHGSRGCPCGGCGLGSCTSASSLGTRAERQHERMHRTLKAETTRPAGQHSLEQQERFDVFREEYNNERPHEALDGKAPAKVYTPSPRPFPEKLADPVYPLHDDTLLVDRSGHIRLPMSRQPSWRRRSRAAGGCGRWTTPLAGDLPGFGPGHLRPKLGIFKQLRRDQAELIAFRTHGGPTAAGFRERRLRSFAAGCLLAPASKERSTSRKSVTHVPV